MPKMKTNRAAAKRLRRTATGKIIRHRSYRGHLMTHKSARRRRRLRVAAPLAAPDRREAIKLLPYLDKKG